MQLMLAQKCAECRPDAFQMQVPTIRGRLRKRKKSYAKPGCGVGDAVRWSWWVSGWGRLRIRNLKHAKPLASLSKTVVYEKACENADPARRGGAEDSRNPFSPRPRSNDEFREAAPVFAARRCPTYTASPSEHATPAESSPARASSGRYAR